MQWSAKYNTSIWNVVKGEVWSSFKLKNSSEVEVPKGSL